MLKLVYNADDMRPRKWGNLIKPEEKPDELPPEPSPEIPDDPQVPASSIEKSRQEN